MTKIHPTVRVENNLLCYLAEVVNYYVCNYIPICCGQFSGKQPTPPPPPQCPMEKGFCVTQNGVDQNSDVTKLNNINGGTSESQMDCLKQCYALPGATGCEVIWDQDDRGCYVHKNAIAKENNAAKHGCWVFSKCTGIYIGYSFI